MKATLEICENGTRATIPTVILDVESFIPALKTLLRDMGKYDSFCGCERYDGTGYNLEAFRDCKPGVPETHHAVYLFHCIQD